MNRHTRWTVVLAGLAVLVGGCSLDRPGQSNYSWQPIQRTPGLLQPAEQDESGLPELTDTSTLSDYLAYAALNNPGLEAAFNRWKAALERAPQVRALPDPRFTYRFYIQEVETRVGAQQQAFGISQKFPWFGKLELRGYAALEAADAERKRYEANKLKLFYQIKDVYHEYYYLWRGIAILKENIQLLKNIERILRTRYKVAAASHPSVIRAQVELGKLDDRMRTLEDLRGPIVARLNAALNRPAGTPLPWPKAIEDQQVSITDDELLAWMTQSNPQVGALDFEIARRKHQIELAKKDYFPDITLGMDYIDTAKSTGGRHPSSDGKDAIIAMVSVNIPIWWEKLSAGVREADHRHRAAIHEKAQAINALSADVKLAAYRFRDADRRIDLYGDTLLPKARESIKATDAAFRAGKASFTDLIDAERVLLEFALAHERALADKGQRLAELEMLVGKEIREIWNEPAAADVQNDDGNDDVGKDTDDEPQDTQPH